MGRLESMLAVAVLLFCVAAPAASASCLDYADYPDSTPFLSSTPTTSARQLSVRDGVACVADYTAGLRVLDVSDPTAPQLVVTVPTGSQCLGLDWVGDRLYLACGYSGLVIVDMADRWAPVVLGAVAPWGFEAAVRVAGDFAYLANAYGQFDVVDVSDPSAPVAVASLAVGWDEAKDVELFGDYALVPSGENGLRVIDVSSPATPSLAATFATAGRALSVAVDESLAYLCDENHGLWILDLGDPLHPVAVGDQAFAAGQYCLDLALGGGFAYAPVGATTLVIDVSDPAQPAIRAELAGGDLMRGVALGGGLLFIAEFQAGVRVLLPQCGDLTDAPDPALRGNALSLNPNPFNPSTRVHFLLEAPTTGRLSVLDVAGRHVASLAEGPFAAGERIVEWTGRDDAGRQVAGGVYFVELRTEAGRAVRKAVLLK